MTAPALPALELPSEKTTPSLSVETSRIWIYGESGVGKTTLATNVADEVLLLATDPGYGAMEVFAQPIGDWLTFRAATKALAETERFNVVVVDTIETLYRHCRDHQMKGAGIDHPADLEYGKGWDLVNGEFKTRIAKLCSLGRGVVFISHEKEVELKARVGTITKATPDMGGAATKWLSGFVDYILRAVVEEREDGKHYALRTEPTENIVAKQRVVPGGVRLPDPLERPADDPAGPLRAALEAAVPSKEASPA